MALPSDFQREALAIRQRMNAAQARAGKEAGRVKCQLRSMKDSGTDVDTMKFLLDLQLLSRDNAAKLKKEFQRIRVSPERLIEFSKIAGSISPKKAQGFISFAQSPPAANPHDLMAKGLKGPGIGKAMADAESDAYAQLVGEVRRYVRELPKELNLGTGGGNRLYWVCSES